MSNYNQNRGNELFKKKINELLGQIPVEKRPMAMALAEQFESKVGVMQEGYIESYFEYQSALAKKERNEFTLAELDALDWEALEKASQEFVPSYTKIATSILGAAMLDLTDLEAFKAKVYDNYAAGGCSEFNAPKKPIAPTMEQQIMDKIIKDQAFEEIDQHSVHKKTWSEVVIKRDEEGNILFDESGNAITEEVEVSNATRMYGLDTEGNIVESEMLMDDLDLMQDFDEDDLTLEGQRAAGIIPLNFDTLSGADADSVRVANRSGRLPLGKVRAKEDGGWEIICPFTDSSDVYQIDSNTYASFSTDQPFRIDASLADLMDE